MERNLYLEERVKVILLKEVSDLFDGETFLKLGKGMEVELPRWLAKKLVDMNYAKYVKEKGVDETLKEVAKFRFLESKKDDPLPTQLPQDFFKRVREVVDKYKNPVFEGKDVEELAQKLLKVTKIKAQLEELIDLRLMKIISKIINEGEVPVSLRERLTPEEQVIADELEGDISQWKRVVIGE
ncbi:DNA replication complex GINS family protein [Ignicoccus hospitalis]|uniref:DNA replication complex GINS family protein n=1 Tax=Ignicoccus hospitalis TaxID=160233 RepID=UPI00164FAE94|nr:DNA replication complex GINS family protein [Ignicoccus hospitalis]HIH90569.1 DNA replication complex GINS family protein [Desulfurococcaceae archaeon]